MILTLFWVIFGIPVILIIIGVVWLWVLAWVGNMICRGGE